MLIQCCTVHFFHFSYAVKIMISFLFTKKWTNGRIRQPVWTNDMIHQENCTGDWTDTMGFAAWNLATVNELSLTCCGTYEAAGACWARITISSVVVPMISFARFSGTHRILPIESWVENYCEDLGSENLNWQMLRLWKIHRSRLKHYSEDTCCIPIPSGLFGDNFEFAKRTYPRNNTQLF